ncbi:hypothetical protein [Streptomyces atratus]|uniref:hypothetical protein n=1 Tax=Streptomyces atratus TaxID=1893 RepID=UPI003664DF84
MLSAAEAAIEQTAEDDAERQRIRAKLYAPPPGARSEGRRPVPGAGMSRAQAQSLAAQLAAEDARLSGGRSG